MDLFLRIIRYLRPGILFLVLDVFSLFCIYGQKGTIEGIVRDPATNEVLPGAHIMAGQSMQGTITDLEGRYILIGMDPGLYNIRVSYVSYHPVMIENVIVIAGKTTFVDVELEPAPATIEGATVVAVRRTGSDLAMLTSVRTSPVIASGISGQQIARTQDRDASEVVRRIPGITIMDNRFVLVRGLSQRYNSVWLNNAATPSSEADVKAFSFDLIPSAMIDNLVIYKSFTPELPADYTGGFIRIITKNMPEHNRMSISYASSWAEGTTLENFYSSGGSKTDWLGFDNGYRSLPDGMPAHLNEYELAQNPVVQEKVSEIGKSLNENWGLHSRKAFPDQRFSLAIQRRFGSGKGSMGMITNLSYSNIFNYDNISSNQYSIYNFKENKPSFTDRMQDEQYTHTAGISLMHNWAFFPGTDHKIEFRNLFNQLGWTRSTVRQGRDYYNDGRHYRSFELRYQSRATYSGQLGGEHTFREGDTRIDWNAGYAFANKKEPDLKRYRQLRSVTDTTRYYMIFPEPSGPDLSSEARYWLDLGEHIWSGNINWLHKKSLGKWAPEIKMGLYLEHKSRQFSARNFGYAKGSTDSEFGITYLPVEQLFSDENINRSTGIKIMEITSRSDSYTASSSQVSGYVTFKLPVTSRLSFYGGVRMEKNRQVLFGYRQGTSQPSDVNRDTVNLFPSANLTYRFNDDHLLRLTYGMSVNRPEFREIAPFYFVDFDENAGIYGNPLLQQANIVNYDLRYEYYPSAGETCSIGLFYKKFHHPIEKVIIGNNPLQYSFENVEQAICYGLEADLRKSFDVLPALKYFSLIVNASLIQSRVDFPEGTLQRDRPLQGQSPFIVNAGVYYDNPENGVMLSILYNIIGNRIIAVGRPSPNSWEDIPDIYESSRHLVDLTFIKRITPFIDLKGGVKDLLNQEVLFIQTIDTNVDMAFYPGSSTQGKQYFHRRMVTRSYFPGRYINLGLALNLR